jgi:hypothetical protein
MVLYKLVLEVASKNISSLYYIFCNCSFYCMQGIAESDDEPVVY